MICSSLKRLPFIARLFFSGDGLYLISAEFSGCRPDALKSVVRLFFARINNARFGEHIARHGKRVKTIPPLRNQSSCETNLGAVFGIVFRHVTVDIERQLFARHENILPKQLGAPTAQS